MSESNCFKMLYTQMSDTVIGPFYIYLTHKLIRQILPSFTKVSIDLERLNKLFQDVSHE